MSITRIPWQGYEKVAEAVYSVYPKSTMSDSAQTVVNLGSGLIAGFAAAIVSQPADTIMVTYMWITITRGCRSSISFYGTKVEGMDRNI